MPTSAYHLKEADEIRQMRIDANVRLKERGRSRECKARLNEELIIIKANLDTKSKERDEAEKNAKLKKKELAECKSVKGEAKLNNVSSSKYACDNHIESVIIKSYEITKSCYHAGNLEGNNIRRLMDKRIVVLKR